MAALYSNENYPFGIVEQLRQLGHDVLTAQEAGNGGRGVPDAEVIRFATAKRRAILTHNRRHFFRLHRETRGLHTGIIACTYDPDEIRQASLIDAAIASLGGTLEGQVLRVYRPANP